MVDVIGRLREEPGEMRGEWQIPNFLSLPEKADKGYGSPPFLFLDSCWCLTIFPNGQTNRESRGWVGVFLRRLNCDSPVTVNFTITTRIADKEQKRESRDHAFTNEAFDWGWAKFMKRSDLQSGEKAVSPSDALDIAYTLENSHRYLLESSLCSRLWNMSRRWNSILHTQRTTDVVLKLEDGEIRAHRAILKSSSAVFARMFDVDMVESQTGEVNIEDATEGALRVALSYIYSGDPEELSCKNVCEVYKVAHKYELQELKEFCAKYMRKTLRVDTVCDVIALADLYQETSLMEGAKDYFAKNKTEIFKTEKWKTFKKNNPADACLVLECVFA